MSVPGHLWKEYAQEVWDEFTRRSGVPERIMSPAEWWSLRGFLLDGIPLRIVLRGFADTRGRGLTLNYYAPSIRETYEKWCRAMGGTV